MTKIQLRCMENDCGIVMYGGVRHFDGLNCCKCGGLTRHEPYNPKDTHVRYERKPRNEQLLGTCDHLYREFRTESINGKVYRVYFYCQKCLDITVKGLN